MNTEQALLWNSLCNLGQLTKLKLNFNGYDVVNKLEQYKDNWCPYNTKKDKVNNRWGLPLTSFDGDITSNQHLNSFGCKPENYSFILDGKLINPDNGYMYFANFQLDHSVFSYSDGVYILIVTIKINRHTHDLILKHSMSE